MLYDAAIPRAAICWARRAPADRSNVTEEAARFFVLYRHGDPDEERLAEDLTRRLGAEGYETFLDKAMTVGTDWVAEIDERLAWCDHLVVLLSEAAMASEMVQGEVRKAVQRRQREGQPSILPVRMRYFGPLEYRARKLPEPDSIRALGVGR